MLVPSQPPCEVGEGQGEKEKQEKSGAARLVLKKLGKTAPGKEAGVGCGFCVCPRELGWCTAGGQPSLPPLGAPCSQGSFKALGIQCRGRGGLGGRGAKELPGRRRALPTRDWQHLTRTQHGIAASTRHPAGNSPLSSSVLPLLCSLVFSCYLCFPQKLALSSLPGEKAPSTSPALRPWYSKELSLQSLGSA